MHGKNKEKKRVAAASRGQVHLNPLGIDAAIKAYRTAVLDSERLEEKIQELTVWVIFAGRFVGMKKLMMLMSVPLCFVGRTRINVPLGSGRRLAIAHPVLMSCQLINRKDCSTMVSLVDFYADNFSRCLLVTAGSQVVWTNFPKRISNHHLRS